MRFPKLLRQACYKAFDGLLAGTTGISLRDLPVTMFLAGGGLSYSGRYVNADSAMQLDAVFACVRLVSETIAAMPLKLYQRVEDKKTSELARNHPLYPLLYSQPNADMTGVEFWGVIVASLLLWGNGFAQIMRRNDGSIIALNPLRPDRVQVRRDPATGALTYIYAWQGKYFQLDEVNMLHIRGMSFDGVLGISPLAAARQSFGTAMAAEEAAGRVFQNGMLSSTYIKAPDYLPKDREEQTREIMKAYSGAIAAGKTPLLQGGWSIENIGLKPEDSQLLGTRSFSVETICRWFGVQPVMIGRMEKSTAWGTGLEQMNLWFLQYGLQPWLVRIEQAIGRCLLSAVERKTHFARHNVDALLRGDNKSRSEYYIAGRQNGYLTANEVREKENLPPLDGGDQLTVQAQMIPLDKIGQSALAAPQGGEKNG